MLRRVFEGWEEEIVRPMLVSVATALVLFLGALLLKPVRDFFFPDEARDYPILCTVEPYKGVQDKELLVDFYFFNRTDKPQSREELRSFLASRASADASTMSPDIRLAYQGRGGTMHSASADTDFNKGKGELAVRIEREVLLIAIVNIEPRSLLKATVSITGIERLPSITITRRERAEIPFEYETLLKGCYTR